MPGSLHLLLGLTGVNFANDVIDLSWTYQWYFGDGTEGLWPQPLPHVPGRRRVPGVFGGVSLGSR
jgi:hypothetical protein